MTQPLQPLPEPITAPILDADPTPQDWGLPIQPRADEFRCWQRQEIVLAYVTKYGITYHAAPDAGVTVYAIDRWINRDVYGFKKRRDLALKLHLETLEREADRRGRDGIDKPVYWRGQRVDTIKEYSDNLLMFRHKRLDPAYKDNYDPRPAQQQAIQITRIVIHGVGAAAVETRQVSGPAVPELSAAQVVEGEVKEAPNEGSEGN